MRHPWPLLTLTWLAATGCAIDAASLSALVPSPRPSTSESVSPAPSKSPSAAPRPSAVPSTGATPDAANAAAVSAFEAKLAASDADARVVAHLFVAGLVAYEVDPMLGRGLMALSVVDGDTRESAASPTGLDFIPARDIYFRTLDRNPALGRTYLDAPASADGSDVDTHVVIDDDYAAAEKGVNEEAGTAKFYLKLNELGAGKRSRPISLKRVDGHWRVSEYSSLFVQI